MDPSCPDFRDGYKDAIDEMVTLIQEIGMRGTSTYQFRHENDAQALPPIFPIHPNGRYIDSESPPLRLYLICLPPRVIILCGGGIKSSQSAQDSPDLNPHFKLANKIGKMINQQLAEGNLWLEGDEICGDRELWLS